MRRKAGEDPKAEGRTIRVHGEKTRFPVGERNQPGLHRKEAIRGKKSRKLCENATLFILHATLKD